MAASDGHRAFREAVEATDIVAVRATLHDEVTFHSPAVHAPVEGINMVSAYLTAAMRTFEDFAYTDELDGGGGTSALVFTARVGDRQVEGLDLLRCDDDGFVVDLTVFVRPLRGLEATIERMGAELARLTG